MSEYESLQKRDLIKIIKSLLSEESEEVEPLEYLFQYYTKRGWYFVEYEECEHEGFYPRNTYIVARKEEPITTSPITSAADITGESVPKFLECISNIICDNN